MLVAGSAAAGTDRELAGQMCFGAGREGGHLLVADMHPLNLGLTANSVSQAIEAVANDAVDPLDAGRCKGFSELICDSLHEPALHDALLCAPITVRRERAGLPRIAALAPLLPFCGR